MLADTPLAVPEALASAETGVIDLPAGLLVLGLTAVLVTGVRLSSRLNQVVTALKVLVVLAVVVVGAFFVRVSNWVPFVPPAEAPSAESGGVLTQPLVQSLFGLEPNVFGVGGVFAAAALVFLAFIGFDVVATTAEEARNPQRDLPIGILGALAIVTVLYMAVSLVITGMQSFRDIDPDDGAPLANAFLAVDLPVMADLIAIGACIGLVVVCMILFLGQTRVGFRDGPRRLAALRAGQDPPPVRDALPLHLAELVDIGTLAAFILVSIGVIVLRRTRPDLPRAFTVPLVPVLPVVAALICLYLMLNLNLDTWIRFVVWLLIGVVVYFAWSRRHSRLNQTSPAAPARRAG
ncbi:APC family permease [Desertihabitans aurantiacus]|uniref:APC family permease n=1 Tax=Desertihabitans aurantiacus TaxID=2282477 RepID=UPI001E3F97AB|nr:amino acid permease [Desertihabitans aurantiacus]